MILAIDVGNSNIVIGCCKETKVSFVERLSTNPLATVLEFAISFKNVLELYGVSPKNITGAIISSVVPSVTLSIREAIKKLTDIEAMVVGPGIKTGLSILIDNPAQLGSDLVVGAAAAIDEYPLPLVIFDLGTATTVSVIADDKSFLGGMIIPGVNVSLNALTARTSQLPKISLEPPKRIIGKNTIESMKSGVIFSTAASLDGITDRIEEELGKTVTAIATGGLAPSITPFCRRKFILDDELMLKGLIIIYNKNK